VSNLITQTKVSGIIVDKSKQAIRLLTLLLKAQARELSQMKTEGFISSREKL
jgi:hypothetical protein